ncbi:polysaccharide lyase [Echinicola jeungdonensis]|uniref:Polysaccharide lyase n=1 Tax=Echinicola jeungdonensis TaxID=709343 RepID=A0ABV5J084_9BACT|nr:polysaccharide lyase [Echinicola jeungdonensis]MDN3671166.1 polysaccharide lyase [Echinicola jeungdonensis]
MNILMTNLRNIITAFLLGVVISACDVSGLEESNLEREEIYKATSSANLIFLENFEESDPFSFAHLQYSEDYSFGRSQDHVLEGDYSGRFELREDDEMASNGTRSEVLFPEQDHNERWYSYSLYLPTEGYEFDSNYDIISQWHQGSGSGSPTTTFRIEDGRFQLESGDHQDNREYYDIAAVERDTWNEFVFHIVHSSGDDGLVEIWMNGEKVLTLYGGNMDKDFDLPRWKVGIYKDDWNYDETTDTDLRILYFDNVRMGDENATFEEMTSIGATNSDETTDTDSTTDSTTTASPDDSTTTNSTDDDTTTASTDGESTSVEVFEAGNSGKKIKGEAKGHEKNK